MKPPFRYFGSKLKIAKILLKDIPPHNCWVEAFCGSAALTFAKSPAGLEIINDIDSEITNLFQQLRDNSKELIDVIKLTPYSREELFNARIDTDEDSELERARKFLIRSMYTINSVFGKAKAGFSYSNSYSRGGKEARVNRWNNLPKHIEKVTERLKDTLIENIDANKLIERFSNYPATLIYLDPPYLAERQLGYEIDENNERFHEKLLKNIKDANCMIFISAYENVLYNDMLTKKDGWRKKEIPTTTSNHQGNNYNRTEIVWYNSQYENASKEQKLPIEFTEKEKIQNKINPPRN